MQASIAPGLLAAATHLTGGTGFTSRSGETDDGVEDDGAYELARTLHVGFISKLFGEKVGGDKGFLSKMSVDVL